VQPLFQGPGSLRDPYERFAFWGTAICALPAALLIGYVLHESIGASQVALFIVIAMVYVTLARGRLLGSSVRVHETQYPRVFAIVKRTCAALEIPMPLVFVREDNLVPVAALGFGEPYALVLSSHWIEVFRDDELAFQVGRELGHIAAGHTRFLSLLSVNGNENPLISLIFGAWLRRCTTTCDKVGLLCCGSLDAAIRSIGVAAFHEFGRKVDYDVFAEQHSEIESDSIFRWGAWLGSEPYATARIASLRRFITSQAYEDAERWFLRERGEEPPTLAAPGTTTVVDKDCAGWWRRFAAFSIDTIVVTAIIGSFATVSTSRSEQVEPSPSPIASATPSRRQRERAAAANAGAAAAAAVASPGATATASATASADVEHIGPVTVTDNGKNSTVKVGNTVVASDEEDSSGSSSSRSSESGRSNFTWTNPLESLTPDFFIPTSNSGRTFWLAVYMTLLVATAGQTFGMMITGLRVVTTDFRRPGIFQTIARYAIGLFLLPLIAIMSFFWRRVLLHDRWTKTRLVKVERVVARATGTG
jgi:hypothetical protein